MQAVWMLLSSFFLASMGVCVKFASAHFHSAELVFYRGAVGLVFMAAYARLSGTSLRTRYPTMHAWNISTVRWAKRLKDWNAIPISWRTALMF